MAQLLNQSLTDAAAALRTLFADEQKTLRSNTVIFQSDHPAVLEMLYRALITAENAHNSHDAIAALNEIVGLTPGQPLLEVLEPTVCVRYASKPIISVEYRVLEPV